MKIGIIGAGTASSVALLAIADRILEHNIYGVEVCCIHDPKLPITLVGESASAVVPHLLYTALGVNLPEVLPNFDGTLRWRTEYNWQDASGKDFSVNYGSPGIHLNSEKFSKWVLSELDKKFSWFTLIEDTVLETSSTVSTVSVVGERDCYQFDFLIDCSGTPADTDLASEEYAEPDFKSVNSVILYPHFSEYHEDFTSSYFHKNGWMFGVPLAHRKAFGYCYNNTITSVEVACADFEKLKNISTVNLRKFSWKQYYKKSAIQHRILAMGNRLYFFEPHQAIPLHYYANLTREFFTTALYDNSLSVHTKINKYHTKNINEIQDLIALNYSGKINAESKFWNHAQTQAYNRLSKSVSFTSWAKNAYHGNFSSYWVHGQRMMEQYASGFEIDLKRFL